MLAASQPTKLRVFFAIPIPAIWQEEMKKIIVKLKKEFSYPGIKWAQSQNLHLTLRFLGFITEVQCTAISRDIAPILHEIKPFVLSFANFMLFPSTNYPIALVYKPLAVVDLITLAIAVDKCVVAHGVEPEKRSFNPHLTIARIRSRIPTKKIAKTLAKISIPKLAFTVDEIILMKSEPTAEGSKYTPIATFSFLL